MVNASKADVADVGRLAGGVVGLINGAELGTIALPIPLVGTFVGAVVGGVVGCEAGGILIRTLSSVGGFVLRSVSAATTKTAGALKSATAS